MIYSTDSLIGQHFIISGRVQGVYYRQFTKNTAIALKVTGWVRNLPNGCVEAQAFGTASQLADFQNKLWKGPPTAEVKDISIQSIAWESHSHFQIIE